MAYHEMRLIITKVLWNFDLELCEESKGWLDQPVYTLRQKGPLVVKATIAERV
jgi:cytochrome P450